MSFTWIIQEYLTKFKNTHRQIQKGIASCTVQCSHDGGWRLLRLHSLWYCMTESEVYCIHLTWHRKILSQAISVLSFLLLIAYFADIVLIITSSPGILIINIKCFPAANRCICSLILHVENDYFFICAHVNTEFHLLSCLSLTWHCLVFPLSPRSLLTKIKLVVFETFSPWLFHLLFSYCLLIKVLMQC